MIEPNDNSTLHTRDNDVDAKASPGVMFTTILLLIGGLLLTSIMLIHYGLKGTDENGEPISGLTRFVEITKSESVKKTANPATDAPSSPSFTTEAPVHTPPTAVKSSKFSFKNLFSKEGDSVRWPRLELNGFGLPSKGEVGFAIINGQHVIEGSTIKGVVLKEILAHGVVVEYKNETKTLIVEMTD